MNDNLQTILKKLEDQNLLDLYHEITETIEIAKSSDNKKLKKELEVVINEKTDELFNKINTATGSLRAPMTLKGRFSFPAMLKSADDILLKYGGHDLAAGFGIKEENLDKLTDCFSEYIQNENLVYDNSQDGIMIVEIEDITKEFLDYILMLDPFGIDFPMPKLKIVLRDGYSIKLMNHKLNPDLCHIRIQNITGFDIMIFNMDKVFYNQNVEEGIFKTDVEMVLNIGQNSFRGKTSYQLIANDYFIV